MTQIGSSGQYSTTEANVWPLMDAAVRDEVVTGVVENSAFLSLMSRMPDMTSREQKRALIDTLPAAEFTSANTGTEDLSQGVGDDNQINETEYRVLEDANKIPLDDEEGLKQTDDFTVKAEYMIVEDIAVVMPIALNVLNDSRFPIWSMIMPKLQEAIGVQVDNAVGFGVGKPDLWPSSLCGTAISRGLTNVQGDADDLAGDLSKTMANLEEVYYMGNYWVLPLTEKAKLRDLRDNVGRPLFIAAITDSAPDMLYGHPIKYVMNGTYKTANIEAMFGDFSKAQFAVREDINFKVFTEGVITDSSNNVVLNLMQQDSAALRVVYRMAWGVENAVHVAVARDSRYPVSIMHPEGAA